MPVDKGRLKVEDERKIQKNYKFLVDELDAEELTATLYQEGVFNLDDKDEILCEKTRRKRVEKFLEKLMFSGPNESFNKFLEALEENYEHVIEELNNTVVSGSSGPMPYDWVKDASPQQLEARLSQADASRVAFCIGVGWEHLFSRLGLSQVVVERERMSNPYTNTSVLVSNLLVKWMQKESKQATWQALLKVLSELEQDSVSTIDWSRLEGLVVKKNIT